MVEGINRGSFNTFPNKGKAASMQNNDLGLAIFGPSAPSGVKEAWNKAAKESGINGLAKDSEGKLTHLTKLCVMSWENAINGGERDVLGNSINSARAAVQTALERLGIPQNSGEKKERLFYEAFLRYLPGVS